MDRRAFLVTLSGAAMVRLKSDTTTAKTSIAASESIVSSDSIVASDFSRTLPDDEWHTFEITTDVHVQRPAGPTRVWLPTPLAAAPYQTTLGDTYLAEGGALQMVERDEIDLLAAQWPEGAAPVLSLASRVRTLTYAVNLDTPTVPPPPDLGVFTKYLRGTNELTVDAAAKSESDALTRGGGTDLERARALFTAIAGGRAGLAAGADPNVAFVRLARAAGLPARAVFGLRLSSADATAAQHCRAEVYLVGFGWVPLDVRDKTFGSWDARWMAYNTAHDVVLPGSSRGTVASLTHPQGETANGRLDSLDAAGFRYLIAVRS